LPAASNYRSLDPIAATVRENEDTRRTAQVLCTEGIGNRQPILM
jgi:hypothetical protein